VTGGIGSGKSEALRAFEALGAAVLSADEVVHRLYLDPDVVAAVVKRFGAEVAPGGVVDRGRLGPAAFADADGLRALEALLHRRDPPPPLLVCEVPLLFEVGLQDTFDAALVVTASEAVRRVRVEGRGQSFNERRDRQIPEAEKVRMASAAFTNDGSVEELEAWVADRFAEYRR
jgi:dephospho-CoA kinase